MDAFTWHLARHLNVASAPGIPICYRFTPLVSRIRRLFSNSSAASTRGSELTRAATAVDGCDYRHWLVVMEPPEGHPQRDEIVHNYYIKTLAMALGSKEEAKKSVYSVSTKYYYAFGCNIPENLNDKIKSLARVRWVLPDTYLHPVGNDYGGEPFIDGDVVPYDDKYHVDWLQDQNGDGRRKRARSRKAKHKKRDKSV